MLVETHCNTLPFKLPHEKKLFPFQLNYTTKEMTYNLEVDLIIDRNSIK